MTAEFRAALRTFARLSDARMPDPCDWPGHRGPEQLEVRDALYLSLLEEQSAAARTQSQTEAQRSVGFAEAVFGDLCGLLIGLDDALLDADPGAGEWPLRQVLGHVLEVERSYASRVAYARTRTPGDPIVNLPIDDIPEADKVGGVEAWLVRLEEARTQARAGASASDAELDLPTQWAGFDLDLRFRLHRFATHLAEHTIQCEKTLVMLGAVPTEAARIVRRIFAARCSHAWLSRPAVLLELNQGHSARAALLAGSEGHADHNAPLV